MYVLYACMYCMHVYICVYVKRNAHMTCGRHISTLALSCCISLYSQLIGSRGLCSYHFVIVTLHVKTQHYISTYIHSLIFTYTCNNIHTLVKMYIVNNLTTCAAGKHVSIDCSRTVVAPLPTVSFTISLSLSLSVSLSIVYFTCLRSAACKIICAICKARVKN